ncbi:MAG TPA: thioredoxin family protein [Gemmatimonadales bacterium]
MVAVPSTMLELGTSAPNFSLPDTEGRTVSLQDFRDARALLVMFICNHCPYVKHVAQELARIGRDYQPKGVGSVAISSNDVAAYPDDGPSRMREEKARVGYPFPYLYDESQAVALAYRAACTPDFYLFDNDRRLVYRGQLDDSRPKTTKPVTGKDLRTALDLVLQGKPAPAEQIASIGCNIKWKPGNEPEYFGPRA